MSDASGTRFTCDGCGRTYAWKPQLAGKRVKCKCGATMTVPEAETLAEAEPDFDADALYALADAEAAAAENAPSQHRVVERSAPSASPKASAAPSGVPRSHAALAVGYQRGPTARELERGSSTVDMARDLYVPLGLFVGGLIVYVSYYAIAYQLRGGAVAAVMFGLFLMTLFKAALLIGFALVAAGPLGVSFGGVWSAVLKLAAIAVFCDGIATWVDAGTAKLAGAGGGMFAGFLSYPVVLCATWMLLIYLFSMDSGESWMVVVVLSTFYFIVRWFLLFALLGAIMSWGGVTLPGSMGGGAGGGNLSNDPLAVQVQEMKDNKQLEEASAYIESGHQEILRPYVKGWYDAGCKNVWFAVGRNFEGKGVAGGVVVELPKDKTARAKCFELLKKYYDGAEIGYDPADLKDDGTRFMSVEIRSAH